MLLGLGYWNYKQFNELKRYNTNDFFNYEHSERDNSVIQTWSSNGKLKTRFLDRNLDYVDDEIIQYSSTGGIIGKDFDNNYNGVFEEYRSYGRNGDLLETNLDKDEDGFLRYELNIVTIQSSN